MQVTSVASMDRRALVANITAVARTAKLYGLPIVVTTVNVKTGLNQPLIHQQWTSCPASRDCLQNICGRKAKKLWKSTGRTWWNW